MAHVYLFVLLIITISVSAMDNEKELLLEKVVQENLLSETDDSEVIDIEILEKLDKKNKVPSLQQLCVDHIIKNPDKIHEIPELEYFNYDNAKKIARGLQKERVRIKKGLSQKNSAKNNAQKLQNNIKYLSQDLQDDAIQFVNNLNQELIRDKNRLESINQLIVHFKSFTDKHEEKVAVTRFQKMKLWLSRHKKEVRHIVGTNAAIYTICWVLFALGLDDNVSKFGALVLPLVLPSVFVWHPFLAYLISGQSFYFYQLARSHKGAAACVWLLPIILTGAIIMPAILLS